MEMIDRLRARLTDNGVAPSDAILSDCLENAKNAILSRRFPYGDWPVRDVVEVDPNTGEETVVGTETYVEDRYLDLQYRLAIEIYNRLGAEGEVSHSENGISRSWDGSWASSQLLNEIVPFAGVVV